MQTAYVAGGNNTWGCNACDTVVLKLQYAVANEHMPDAFTPAVDVKNDIFYPKASGVNVIRRFRIYNRSGQLVF